MTTTFLKKAFSILAYTLYISIVIVACDVLIFNKLLGYGYPRHYREENILRYPAPYVAFVGKPNVEDHNELGFRGPSLQKAKPGMLKIAFFGGSTGYQGDPPIANIVEDELARLLDDDVFVANYSVVSSNHRQHLHGIIEFLPQFKPDLVVFYGGYNETLQSAYYDPRPGYPYNFFYRAETTPFAKLLLENSAIAGEIDKSTGFLSGLEKLRDDQQPLSDDWNDRIADKYLETLVLAGTVAGALESDRFGTTHFMSFYQPYQVPDEFLPTHMEIIERIQSIPGAFDVSSEYDALGPEVYADIVHVNQLARNAMGKKIAEIIAIEIQQPDYN